MGALRKYSNYIFFSVKTRFHSLYTYKAASFLNYITQMMFIFAQYFLWKAIYDHSSTINSYTFTDMIIYLVISSAIGRLYPFNISSKFGRMVKSGEIIHNLLKPIPFEFQLLTDSLGELLYKILFIFAPIIMTGYFFLGIRLSLSIREVLLFILFWSSSYVFIFVLELFIGVFSYYTQSLWGINNFKRSIITLLSGKLLPLNFYPSIIRKIIYYLPFSSIYFIPINILLGKEINSISIFLFILWGATMILFLIYRYLSSIMIKNIMIQGG